MAECGPGKNPLPAGCPLNADGTIGYDVIVTPSNENVDANLLILGYWPKKQGYPNGDRLPMTASSHSDRSFIRCFSPLARKACFYSAGNTPAAWREFLSSGLQETV